MKDNAPCTFCRRAGRFTGWGILAACYACLRHVVGSTPTYRQMLVAAAERNAAERGES